MAAPLAYKMYQWRRQMRMSYKEMAETPYDIIQEDLDIARIESDILGNQE